MARASQAPIEVDDVPAADEATVSEEAITLGIVPTTDLERALVAARQEFAAANGRFLTREELEREVAERRGGAHLKDLE